MRKTTGFIVFLLVGLYSFSTTAQQYYFGHYDIENGLVESHVKNIYQDSNYYLWVGTESGVSRFNGTDFVNFVKADGIHGNIVSSICQSNDQIFLRTGIGVSLFKNNAIQPYFVQARIAEDNHILKDAKGILWLIDDSRLATLKNARLSPVTIAAPDDTVLTISLDKNRQLYAVVYRKGIFTNVGGAWKKIAGSNDHYKNVFSLKLLFDKTDIHKMYLLTPKKLFEINSGVTTVYHSRLLDTLDAGLLSLEQDHNGDLWVGTTSGACYLNNRAPIYFNGNNGFTNHAVLDIFSDKEGIIWLGTAGDGLYKFQGVNVVSYQNNGTARLKAISGIAADESNLWFGTMGSGLLQLHRNTFQSLPLSLNGGQTKDISCLFSKPGLPLLVGTSSGLLLLHQQKFTPAGKPLKENINTAIYDQADNIWVGTPYGCYYLKGGRFKRVDRLEHNVLTITAVGKDSVLAGTHFGLMLIVKGKIDNGFHFERLNNTTVISLIKVNNLIIAGTSGEGIFIVDIHRKLLKNVSSTEGFLSNDVYSLVAADLNTIWAGTGKGIVKFRLDYPSLAATLLPNPVPNPIVEFSANSIIRINNKIWAGSPKGIFVYSTGPDPNMNEGLLPVINIEGIKVIDEHDLKKTKEFISSFPYNIPDRLKLSYSRSRIVITFKGMYYTDPENIRYQYRLKGLEARFSSPSKLNQADYTALAPGTYRFEVKAITSRGVASYAKVIMLEIAPAFYQTSLFYALIIFLLVTAVILVQQLIAYRKNRQRVFIEGLKRDEQIRIREQTAEDFHDDIGNKLTRIIILTDTLKGKSEKSDEDQTELIKQIQFNAAALYSGTKDILWALDPQNENLFEIFTYIKNLAIDIFADTHVELVFKDLDFKQDKVELPLEFSRNISLIFKEILHNVLKHAEATKVYIGCSVNEDYFSVEVTDDGKGYDTDKIFPGRGLKNIRSRAQRINGTINIKSRPGSGTQIKLRFIIVKT